MDERFNFGVALARARSGAKVTREGWNGKGMHVELRLFNDDAFRRPFLCLRTVTGELIPWVASQSDLLADDWLLAPAGNA